MVYTEAQYRERYFDAQVKITRRVEILEPDGKTLWGEIAPGESRLISGSVSVDYSRDERRSLDVTLTNFDNKLVHKPEGFWYNKVLRAYRGIEFQDADGIQRHEVPLGKFLIDRVSAPRFPRQIKITARDFTKKMLLSKFIRSSNFPAGTNIAVLINALCANAGVFDRIVPATTEVLGSDMLFERGTSRWEAVKRVAEAFSYEVFFDAYGYFVMRKFLDPTLSPVSYEFKTGTSGTLIDWEKSTNDTRIYNVVSVIGTDDNSLPIYAEARNEHPASPTRIDELGERVLPFESAAVTTQAQADELALALLQVNALEEYEINMTSLVAPWMEAGEITRFLDPDAPSNDPDRFLLTSIGIPMGLESMSALGRRVTIVG